MIERILYKFFLYRCVYKFIYRNMGDLNEIIKLKCLLGNIWVVMILNSFICSMYDF